MDTLHSLHARFLSLLPRIEAHARIYFRDVRCPGKKADCIADTIALTWKWFVRLDERGKDATQFASTHATLAARAVHCGRRVAGMERAKDVMNARTQQRQGFTVGRLPDFATLTGNLLTDALADNTVTPPPDAAAFRVDFPRWMARCRTAIGACAAAMQPSPSPTARRTLPPPIPTLAVHGCLYGARGPELGPSDNWSRTPCTGGLR